MSAQDEVIPLLLPETSVPREAVIGPTVSVGSHLECVLGIRVGVSGGRLLSPVSQSALLSHCQDFLGERPEQGPSLAVTGESAGGGAELVPLPPLPPTFPTPPTVVRGKRHMKL